MDNDNYFFYIPLHKKYFMFTIIHIHRPNFMFANALDVERYLTHFQMKHSSGRNIYTTKGRDRFY